MATSLSNDRLPSTTSNAQPPPNNMTTPTLLSEIAPHQSCKVLAILSNAPDIQRLQEMGILPGTMITVIRRAPLGDPIELEVRGYKLSIRKREAAEISVQLD